MTRVYFKGPFEAEMVEVARQCGGELPSYLMLYRGNESWYLGEDLYYEIDDYRLVRDLGDVAVYEYVGVMPVAAPPRFQRVKIDLEGSDPQESLES